LAVTSKVIYGIDNENVVQGLVGSVLNETSIIVVGSIPGFGPIKLGGSPGGTRGGIPDLYAAQEHAGGVEDYIMVGELKSQRVPLQVTVDDVPAAHPIDMLISSRDALRTESGNAARKNLLDLLQQTVSYQLAKLSSNREPSGRGIKYAFCTNYDVWFFIRVVPDDEAGIAAELSPFFTRSDARLALASVLLAAYDDRAVALRQANMSRQFLVIGLDGARHHRTFDGGNGNGTEGPQGRTNLPSAASVVQGARQQQLFFAQGTVVAGHTFMSTKEALGIDHALAFDDDAQVLWSSDKSTTFHGMVRDLDLVWRQIDVEGLPKSNRNEFGDGKLEHLIRNELTAYMELQDLWGTVVPHFVCFAQDFNMLWVMVTSYEGVAVSSMTSVPRHVLNKARDALRIIHARGILHGDVEPQNAVFRERDGAVLWVDFEFSRILDGGADTAQGAFERELAQFDESWALLQTEEEEAAAEGHGSCKPVEAEQEAAGDSGSGKSSAASHEDEKPGRPRSRGRKKKRSKVFASCCC
jgi:tRNA A-37 threonylcarbamoyl transferase component Bud32